MERLQPPRYGARSPGKGAGIRAGLSTMSTSADIDPRPHPVAAGLRTTLERLANALTHVNLDTLLACESEMASTLATTGRPITVDPAAKAATARELLAARAALVRCSRLGATLADLTRISLTAHGIGHTYDRRGDSRNQARVHRLEAKG